jgi:hypothetical protein
VDRRVAALSRHARLYRGLLHLYPANFRREYADEMTRLFEDQLRDARLAGGIAAIVRVWAHSTLDVLVTAPVQHIRREERVPRPVGPTGVGMEEPPTRSSALPRVLVGLVPIWLQLAIAIAAPRFSDPVFDNPPGIAGLPAGVLLLSLAMVWTAIGAVVLLKPRSTAGVIGALVIFVAPASLVVLFGPALILILQNIE